MIPSLIYVKPPISGLSKGTLLASDTLPKYQPAGAGGKYLIRKSELFRWIEQSRVECIDLDSLVKKAVNGLREKKPTSA
jgi:hypothetical protein